MQQGDYSSAPYYQYPHLQDPSPSPNPYPTPAPADPHQTAYASAPPFSTSYAPSDHSAYSQNYPPYHQNPDLVTAPPTAPRSQPFNSTPQPSSFPPIDSQLPSQVPPPQQSYYGLYDQHQTPPSYAPPPPTITTNPNPSPSPNSSSSYSSLNTAPYSSSVSISYDNPYETSVKFDQGGGYVDDRYGSYNPGRSEFGSDLYGKQPETGNSRYDSSWNNDGYGDGVYAYQGGKVEPYGARGTAPKSSTWSMFDDYGRPINVPSGKDSSVSTSKIVKAVPKADLQDDVKSGVQKFRVKMLAESGGQTTMDVLCQIGLDGIRMLDPSSGRTLRIYPLENITRCEVVDSSILAFWSKSAVDIEPRRIRLQSSSYTTNTLLDIVTAATVQLKEMGGRSKPLDPSNTNEQPAEKKKGFIDWMNLIKPGNEEKDHWVPDEAVSKCNACGINFGAIVRRHHCRNCGDIFCDKCTHGRIALTAEENAPQVRVCDRCMAEVTQRLTNAKEASKPQGFQSHEDLTKKLLEEMERNRRSPSSKSDGSGSRSGWMKEVACPTCTVHLQVQVPSSGSETIECGVCQNPFLVNAH